MLDNPVLHALKQRNACGKLAEPGPDAGELNEIIQAALRAPDHAGLKPWRFLLISGAGRNALGQLFVDATLKLQPQTTDDKQASIAAKPLRAPLIIAVIARVQAHPKVPGVEQILSAGCAAQNILLAAESFGYGAIWRTGEMAFNRDVMQGLGLASHEQLLGFIYIGTRAAAPKTLPKLDPQDFSAHWPG